MILEGGIVPDLDHYYFRKVVDSCSVAGLGIILRVKAHFYPNMLCSIATNFGLRIVANTLGCLTLESTTAAAEHPCKAKNG